MTVTDVTVDEGFEQGWRLLNQNGEVLWHQYWYNGAGNVQTDISRIIGRPRTSDVSSKEIRIYADHAYAKATTNITGGVTRVAGGIGIRKITITNYASLSGAVFKFNVCASLATLTEGVDYTAQTSNNVTAANIADAINTQQIVSGLGDDAEAVGNVVYIRPHPHQHQLDIYTTAAGATVTCGQDGELSLMGSFNCSYRTGLATNDVYPVHSYVAQKFGSTLGNGFGASQDYYIQRIDDTFYPMQRIGSVGFYRDGADNTGIYRITPYNAGSNNRSYFMSTAALYPATNGTQNLGASGNKWNNVYATNGTIQTSDERLKQEIRDLTDAEARAFEKIRVISYRLRAKGRRHFGVSAQQVIEAFLSEGLDAFDYGIVCKDDDGLLSVRYDELQMGMIEAQNRRLEKLEAMLLP